MPKANPPASAKLSQREAKRRRLRLAEAYCMTAPKSLIEKD